MRDQVHRAIAVVGVGAVLPDAQNAKEFWNNVSTGRYSISETPVDRWDPALYYDADPKAPDKTYSKIGGWVREFNWEPLKWRLPIPPKVAESMDRTQKWSIMSAREALLDYGYPERPLDGDRTAVILGNAMAGDQHYKTALRIFFPEFSRELDGAPSFQALPDDVKAAIIEETMGRMREHFPTITEDTMPGELANIIAGRVAAVFNFHGPNFTADAACASAMAAFSAAISGLEEGDYDAVLTGGIDSNMSAPSYTKFCKIGALSATGTRPYDQGADGFVMGEGAAVFLLKRLEDAEDAGDKIYAVVRGVGGSSDGKGKGITAPNPIGQKLAIERAWAHAGENPSTVSLIEGHGTSTRVGDVVEVQSMVDAFADAGLPNSSIPIGSVKSNIGHLKGAAGAAGLLKATLALHHKQLPPSIGLETPNPKIGFGRIPFYVNTELRPWDDFKEVRRAGVSAFGFGGTNFHAVLEEHVPGRIQRKTGTFVSVPAGPSAPAASGAVAMTDKAPLRGSLVLGAGSTAELATKLDAVLEAAKAGRAPDRQPPAASDLDAAERLAIDFGDAAELAKKATNAAKGLRANNAAMWKALRAQGIFYRTGAAPKTAFLYTGQGSQYVNMLRELRELEPIVADTFREADDVMTPLLGQPLSEIIFVDPRDKAAVAAADEALRQTAITQPAVLATDLALTRLLAAYGTTPDMVMGHSLGEYGALVASGALGFREALEAVSARGREMTKVSVDDNGLMAAVLAPIDEVEAIVSSVDGYVVIANINSYGQSVIGGSTPGVTAAMEAIAKAGHQAIPLPVSHAFHTEVVAPASGPLKKEIARLGIESPKIPIVANVTGELYPMGPNVAEEMIELLGRQIASPVQFVKGLETLYEAGARIFVEVGPKSALARFTDDVLGSKPDTLSLFTNHPKIGDVPAFNAALTGLYASGHGAPKSERKVPEVSSNGAPARAATPVAPAAPRSVGSSARPAPRSASPVAGSDRYAQLGRLFADFLDQGMQIYRGGTAVDSGEPVVVTGATVGLPGGEKVFADENVDRMLHGQSFIDAIPVGLRGAMADKKITRLVKSEKGGPRFETIDSPAEVIKLAGRGGDIALSSDFGIPEERAAAMDSTTRMAVAAGVEALRDAGIPLVMHYKTTSKGTKLPDRWGLPVSMQDETGVIFGSAFPGSDMFMGEARRYFESETQEKLLEELRSLRARMASSGGDPLGAEIDRRIAEIESDRQRDPYTFDRRFLFKALSMGHSQLAEYIGARGPNTQINAACASGTQAVALAEDWIARGRCRRVVVVTADNVTSDNLMEWIGSGFLASGAAATDELLEDAALPFDRRRHGLILGMGASGMVIESADAARERGLRPIAEVLGTVTANSAFHGSRLNIEHIQGLAEKLISDCEARHGIDRSEIAPNTVFVSHETYTPARGGSAQAEISTLRKVFGAQADSIVIANTKGMTGHAMGAGVEDATAVKILETGLVPPVANFKEVDPELGALNLSKGGSYPVQYALRLGAGFGSQISLSLCRWIPSPDGRRPAPRDLGYRTRVEDPALFERWMASATGYSAPELEVVNRTLRVKDQGPSAAVAVPVGVAVAAPVAVAAAVAAPVAAAVAAPVAAPATDSVKERVLGIVAEQTGYPSDMLDLELDLEADLGIDTVKQAETFAAVREAYDIPREDNLELRAFPTLGHVVQFVRDRRPDLAAVAVTAAATAAAPVAVAATVAATATATATAADPVTEKVLSIVAEQTGYPSDMLDLELDLEADLGIDTVKQAETFAAVREAYDIPREDNLELREFPTLGHVVQFVRDRRPDLAAVAAAAPVAVAAPAAAPVAAADPVTEKVLSIVAEQTGYPSDMLDLELDLEADLGIDTVKQAETFAAVREAYDIPREDNLELREFPTLGHVVQFVRDRRPDLVPAPAPVPTAVPAPMPAAVAVASSVPAPAEPAASGDSITDKVLEVVASVTGYPPEMLELDLDLEADLGIDTVKQAETFAAVREAYGIPRDDKLELRDFPTLNHVIGWVKASAPEAAPSAVVEPATDAVSSSAATDASHEPAEGLRRVPVAVLRPPLSACKPTGVQLVEGARVLVMSDRGPVGKALIKQLKKLGVDALVIDDTPAADELERRLEGWMSDGPIQGVYWLAGLDREDPIAELSPDAWTSAVQRRAKLLFTTMRTLYEQISAPGTFLMSATRLGGKHGFDDRGAVAPLGGAVGGFTKTYKREKPEATVKVVDFEAKLKASTIADRLIAETLSDPGACELGYAGDERWAITASFDSVPTERPFALGKDSVFAITGAAGSIVSAIVEDLAKASGGTFHLLDLTPEPDAQDPDLRRFASDRDGLQRELFERLKQSGQKATPVAVQRLLGELERKHAALKAIESVRAAGGEVHYHSVNLLDKEAVAAAVDSIREQSGRIDALVHAAGLEISHFLPDKKPSEFDLVFDVKATGWYHLLSSIGDMPLGAAVVFSSIAGRFGNGGQTDYSAANELLAKSVSSFRNARPGTRGVVVDWTAWADIGMASRGSIPKMMELAGIDMLKPGNGIPVVRNELEAGTSGEVVIGGALGILMQEWDATGGLDPQKLEAVRQGPMSTHLVAMGVHTGLQVETTLDPQEQPFLYDHKIGGTAVLPGVMGLEGFGEISKALFPDWHIRAIEGVDFLTPFKFYRDEPRTLTLRAQFTADGDELLARCQLIGTRSILGNDEVKTHFSATVRLARELVERGRSEAPPHASDSAVADEDIYRVYFHGPAYQVLDTAWRDNGVVVGRMREKLPDDRQPAGVEMVTEPRLVELCFQTAGVWQIGTTGRMGLPQHIDELEVLRPADAIEGRLHAVVSPRDDGKSFDAHVTDEAGNLYVVLRGYQTAELPEDVDPDKRKPLRAAMD